MIGVNLNNTKHFFKNTKLIVVTLSLTFFTVNSENLRNNFSNNTNNDSNNFTNSDDFNKNPKVKWYIITFLSILYGTISMISVFGNSLIIMTVFKNKRMRNVTNFFISNLAVADIVIGVLVTPFQFQAALLQRWIFPSSLCKIAPFAATLSVNVSIFTLVAISLDRYHVILYPFKQKLRKKQCYIIILLIWLISLLLSVVKLLNFTTHFTNDSFEKHLVCAPKNGLVHTIETIILIVIQYIIPFVLIVFAYSRIGFHIYYDDTPSSVTSNQTSNKKKVIKMILIVVILFMVCWAPLQIFNFLNVVFPNSAIFTIDYNALIVIWLVFNSLAMSNSCYNVFIYGACSARFQREFRKHLPCIKDDLSYVKGQFMNNSNPRYSFNFNRKNSMM